MEYNPPIQPIETSYDGYLFRSRLEARWAVFFNSLKIPYEYEKEGYRLPSGRWYLPDFWLPKQDCWFEVKPIEPTKEEIHDVTALGVGTHKSAFIMFGTIPSPENLECYGFSYEEYTIQPAWILSFKGNPIWDYHYVWCECSTCGLIGLQYDARSARLSCGHNRTKDSNDRGYNGNSPRLLKAYRKARQANFE